MIRLNRTVGSGLGSLSRHNDMHATKRKKARSISWWHNKKTMDDRKRPAVEEEGQRARLFVPQVDLTTDGNPTAFLSDRQMLAWAYRTETELRFRKLQGRGGGEEGGEPTTISTTLDSKYLLELYPKPPGSNEPSSSASAMERDRYSYYQRKAIPFACRSRCPDGSLVPLVMSNFERKEERLELCDTRDADFRECVTVPPNLLVFEMLLEAFMGYNLRGLYNSKDPTMPRAAVMGGAVVAALTAWRQDIFRVDNGIEELLEIKDERKYLLKKSELIREWNNFFLYNQGRRRSNNLNPFSDGDVDIFLQASPLTRALNENLLERGLTQNSVEKISEFCGGVGLCQTDLQRFSAATINRLRPTYREPRYGDIATFVFSLAKNGLSFLLTPLHDSYDRGRRVHDDDQMEDIPWARTTQLIMLNHRADLLGALMDFDLSIATCAYDGTTVRLTPRAAYSLQTLSSVVTPFTIEETRNRKRIVKYFKRGFTPYLIDPCCQHKEHCVNCSTVIENFAPSRDELCRGGPWKSRTCTLVV